MYTDESVSVLQSAHTQRRLVILPIGSCEQHGPYLPIDTDLRIAELLAHELAKTFSYIDTLLLPSIPFSCSWEHKGPGTLALNVSTVSAIIHDITVSLRAWKTSSLLVLVNWHGGNDALASIATEVTAQENIPIAVIPSISQVGKAWDSSQITTANDIHAGAIETSVIQAFWPELVKQVIPTNAHDEPDIKPAKAQAVFQAIGSYRITKNGIWGAPEQANSTKGKALIEKLIQDVHKQTARLLELVDRY